MKRTRIYSQRKVLRLFVLIINSKSIVFINQIRQITRIRVYNCLLLLVTLLPLPAFAQFTIREKTPKEKAENAAAGLSRFNFYGEASTFIIVSAVSLNVEARIFSTASQQLHLLARTGIGYYNVLHFFDDGVNAWVVPVALTFLSGKGKHHFEGNLGALLGSIPNEPLPILIDLGYRFQRPGSGNIFRAKVGTTGFGISLGHTF